jgi:hypothetical protein
MFTVLLIAIVVMQTGIFDPIPIAPGGRFEKDPEPLTRRQAINNFKAQAQAMLDAMTMENFNAWADLTLPAVLEKSGGREKWMEAMEKMLGMAKHFAIKMDYAKVEEPFSTSIEDTEYFGVIPYVYALKSTEPKGNQEIQKSVQSSFLVGVSIDGGMNWKFMDGKQSNNHRRNRERVKEMIPNLPDDLQFP